MARDIARKGFDLDLRDGQMSERAFGHVLWGPRTEIKRDEKAAQTENLFVEFMQPDGRGGMVPSGILVTTADQWAFHVGGDLCWIVVPTPRLKELYEEARAKNKVAWGGDGKQYLGALVPKHWVTSRKPEPP